MADPIEPAKHGIMNDLAAGVDHIFNGSVRPKKIAFCMPVANFGDIEGGRVNYISNADRADMIAMVKEWLARIDGRYSEGGRSMTRLIHTLAAFNPWWIVLAMLPAIAVWVVA